MSQRCAPLRFAFWMVWAVPVLATGALAQSPGPIGFAPSARQAQAKAEERAVGVPTPEQARAWLHKLTEDPHVAGTQADRDTAEFVRDKLRSWGWEAELAELEVLLNYPVEGTVKLEIVRPEKKTLKVIEDALAADKDSASPLAFPAFHGYGVSGEVTGQVVYVNYGRPEDYSALEKLGVDVEGRIVLARYGEQFRGLKVREAQKRGAIGILIYSDPADDGYDKGDTYPTGPYRPPSALQRGSVQFLSLGPGDPSTPNGPSIKGAKRLPIDVVNGFTTSEEHSQRPQGPILGIAEWEKETGLKRADYYATIPSLPISYESAQPILAALGGPNVPSGWQGGLPLAYHTGPGPAEVHFSIGMEYKLRPIWNVIAKIKGTVEPDSWVLLGNHRDAWVYGAVDPSSGTAATLEACRAIGAAVKAGWRPRRTIIYASWDAEEYGLVGSTEWAEEHAAELDKKAALLVNVDSAVSGPDLDLDGVPSLRDMLLEAAGSVTDVRSGKPLRDVWTAKRRSAWASNAPIDLDDRVWGGPAKAAGSTTSDSATARHSDGAAASRSGTSTPHNSVPASARARFSPQLNALGSGSDYTVFLDHLGVPSIDVGFKGRYGVYHSIYDDFYWMEKFGDPEFVTHATAAKLYTLLVMRAASADVLPFRFLPYGQALREQVDDLRRLVERKARSAEAGDDKPPIEFTGLANVVSAVRAFQEQAAKLDKATEALANAEKIDSTALAKANDALVRVERAFLLRAGLPGRPWFKHSVYAPGLTTGYACWPLPGVRQAILENKPELLTEQVHALVSRIEAATAAMRSAAEAAQAATTGKARGAS